jgi:hypothetical protein
MVAARQGGMGTCGMSRSRAEKMNWRQMWNEGTDVVMDVLIGGVCETLYSEGGEKTRYATTSNELDATSLFDSTGEHQEKRPGCGCSLLENLALQLHKGSGQEVSYVCTS